MHLFIGYNCSVAAIGYNVIWTNPGRLCEFSYWIVVVFALVNSSNWHNRTQRLIKMQ